MLPPIVGSLLTSGLQNAGSMIAQAMANKQNQKLALQANRWNIEQWNRQNEYNAPENQMLRLKQAGLNPNLVYGSGNVSGNVTSSAPRAEMAQMKNIAENLRLPSMLAEISQYQDIRQKQSNIDLTAQAIENQKLRNEALGMSNYMKGYDKFYYPANVHYKSELVKSQSAYQDARTQQEARKAYFEMQGDKDYQRMQSQLNQQLLNERDLRSRVGLNETLRPYGVSDRDPFYMRAAATLWREIANKYNLPKAKF